MNNRQIKISIQLPGQFIELTRERGWGDNPRFFAQQVDDILDSIKGPIRDMIVAEHGEQSVERALNDSR